MQSETALEKLMESGLLGVLLALALITLVFLYKELSKERTERVNDLKDRLEKDSLFYNEIKLSLQNLRDLFTKGNQK